MKCAICGREIDEREAHNGEPLTHGKVCPHCNYAVIAARLQKMVSHKHKKGEDK